MERFRLDIVPSGVPAILPDGSGVVYNGSGQLLLRRWTDLESEPIPGTEGVGPNSTPVVSPSGAEVAYVAGDALEVAPLAGGVVRTLADSADCCARWGPDDFIYYRTTAQNIDRVPASGGAVEVVMEQEVGSLGDFQVLPGGEVAVFSDWSDSPHIEAVRLATGERKVLTPGAKPYVMPGGYLVFGSVDGQILAAPFDADALELTGPEVPLVDGVMVALDYPVYSLSETGTLVYHASAAVNALQFVWVTRSGEVTPVVGAQHFRPSLTSGWRRLSPDGGRIAFGRRMNGNDDVWIQELSEGRTSRLTFGDASDTRPEWAPDGWSVTYRSGPPGQGRLWSKPADGTGEAELLFDGFDVANGVWSPDGTWLVLQRAGRAASDPARDILGIRPGVDTVAVPLVASPGFEEVAPAISRDGRWLAYSSNESGRHEIYVRPFPNVDDGIWQVSTEGGIQPVWAHDGRELFFINSRTRELVAAEYSTAGDTFLPTRLTTLF
ncbi:MAG TPA: hypothetical protein VE173_06595, partial [Longimicrobiales bacterium]|nr:hypothetical protein [Longimicrobiales bacterium]